MNFVSVLTCVEPVDRLLVCNVVLSELGVAV